MVLRIGEVDYTKKIVKPTLSLCKPNREIIDILDTAYDIEMDELLGALNELSFKLPIYIDKHHRMVRNNSIDIIKGRYIVLLELGKYKEYFLINQIDRVSNNDEYLEVTCLSLAYELNDKIIRGYEVVSYNCSAILKDLLKDSIWRVKYVDSEFDLTYRSFEVSSSTALEAVIELAKTFNALLLYDTIERTISFYNPANVGEDKGFSVSYGKYLESVNQEDNSEEIITRLRMFGKEEISIQDIIPSGQQYIEDFNYFVYPYEETFNEINKSYTSTEMISNWQKTGYTSNFSPVTNGLRIDSSTGNNRIINNTINLENFRVSFNVKNHINNVGAKYGMIFGYVNSNDYYQLIHERTSNDIDEHSLRLYRVYGGNSTLLTDKSVVKRWSFNIDYKIVLEVFNGVISIKIDNIIALDYTDKSFNSGGFGFIAENNSVSFTDISSTLIDHNIINHSEFMTDELCYYIKRYEELLKSSEGEFNTLVDYRTAYYAQLNILDDELQDLTTEYKKLLDERDILNTRIARSQDSIDRADNIEQPTDFLENSKSNLISQRDAKLVEISLKQNELNAKNSEIAVVQVQFDSLMHKIDLYRAKIALENNFPSEQLKERKQFVIEKEWQDNNIIESEALLKEGLKVFDEYRQQKITVNIDVVNFLAMIEEQINWDKLVLADNFYIDHERLGFVYQAKITGINYNFEGGKINLTISNVKDVYSNKNKFLEMLYKNNQISSSVSMKEWEWDLSLENRGSINDIINSMWDANRQAIMGAKDQVVEISDRGLIIRDENDPMKYLVAINGMIALTNDGGATFKHAITTDGATGESIKSGIIKLQTTISVY